MQFSKNVPSKHICMVAYTNYMTDARVRREAETVASRSEFDVTVLSLKIGKKPKKYYVRNVRVRELNVSKYRGKSTLKYLLSYCVFLFFATSLCAFLLLKNRIDMVHIHNMPNFLVFAGILPRLFGKKMIFDIHDSVPETYATKFSGDAEGPFFKLLCLEERFWSRLADKVICVNHIQREALKKRHISKSQILVSLNVPDPVFFRYKKHPVSNDDDSVFRLVYHGTVAKRLGLDFSVRAVERLVDRIPMIRFRILGDGDDIEEIADLSKSLGLSDKVKFNRKMLPLEDLFPLLENMHLGIISNRKDVATDLMLPVKMLEYVALGIPVVAPRLKAIQYYFHDDMVFFFEPEDVASLSNAIFDAFTDINRREEKARNAMMFFRKYTWESYKSDLQDLYESLLNA